MSALLRIAYRNMLRHRGRTVRSAFTIAVALVFFIYFDSMYSAMDRGAIDNMINLSTSAVKIHTKRYAEEKQSFPLNYGVPGAEEFRSVLAGQKQVKGVAPRTRFLGELSNYTETVPVSGTVISPSSDTTVFKTRDYLEGDYFSESSVREIILGRKLAQEMGVEIGDYITLYALTRYDSRNADDFKIIGLLNTTDPAINRSTVMITYRAADGFLDLEGLATEMNVGLHQRVNLKDLIRDAQEVKTSLSEEISNLHVETFTSMGAAFFEVTKQKKAYSYVFLGVILIIAAVGIFNSVLMSVYERIREIGVLRAHGMRPNEIITMFVLEGFLTGLTGSTLGLVLGIAANLQLTLVGIPLDKMAGSMGDASGMPFWGTIYGQWNVGTFVLAFVFGTVVATLAGIIPARKGGTVPVTSALRYV
ncbi:MAG: ABC transporter permease [Chitinispirillaceae bacterium]